MKLSVQCSDCGEFVEVKISKVTGMFSGMCNTCRLWNHLMINEINLKPNKFYVGNLSS